MTTTLDLQDAGVVVDVFERAAAAMLDAPQRVGSAVRLAARGRLVVTGDLHDNPFHLAKIVELARLGASTDHHVVLHELIHGENLVNGMDFSYRILVRVAALILTHPGQVHPMLANHELAQLTRKGVSKGAGNSVELFRDALGFVFGDAEGDVERSIDGFIRAMPLAVRSEDGVLCAHSLPTESKMPRFDMGVLDRPLADADYLGPDGAAYLMTWGRGYTPEQVERLAEAWGVELFCLGHEHVETGIEMRGTRVLVLNSDHERAVALPLDLARLPSPEEALMYALPLRALGA